MQFKRLVVIGASAGGIEALLSIVRDLSPDLSAPILVVVHISPDSPGYLPEIIASHGRILAKNATDGEILRPGCMYVAPPDRHLLVEKSGRLHTPRGPRENRTRPAVDPLFRSAALLFGPRAVGVILSGGLDDGSAGLRGIKMCGGTTIVQDPTDAIVDSMPINALRSASIDYCRPASDIGPLITELAKTEPATKPICVEEDVRTLLEKEVEIAGNQTDSVDILEFTTPSIFTCPECHGALQRIRESQPIRFRCHTGHAFTADTLFVELSEATEQTIWSAVRSLQEQSMLLDHLADHWQTVDSETAKKYRLFGRRALSRANQIRKITQSSDTVVEAGVPS